MRAAVFFAAFAALLCAAPIQADVNSGPAVGEAVPVLEVLVVAGNQAGETVDLTASRGNQTATVYVFVQAERFDRPIARFLRGLDESVNKTGKGTVVIAVWLTATPDVTKEYLPRVQTSLKLQATTYALHPDVSGPEAWGVNPDAHVTVAVAGKQGVAATFGYLSVNETLVPEVEAAIKKATKP